MVCDVAGQAGGVNYAVCGDDVGVEVGDDSDDNVSVLTIPAHAERHALL